MSVQVIRFGIIGAGGLMGREFAVATARWPALLRSRARPQLVAVCDTDPAAFEWYTSNFDAVRTTTDYTALLADDTVDAVYCAVPHHLHERLYIDVLNAGKHLLAEKPFGIDAKANAKIMDAVRSHPEVLVRVSSEFPFFPGAQRIVEAASERRFGRIIQVKAGLLHSGDLDPTKPINWKRIVAYNGEYGCLGDLGMHVVHLPFRFGWRPANVRAVLSNIVPERPDPDGRSVACETYDNAILLTEVETDGYVFPMILETKRIAPGEMNTWYLEVLGTEYSIAFSTKYPKTLWELPYTAGQDQGWRVVDLGQTSTYRTITGQIFEFGFADAILQMWAAFIDELAGPETMQQPFRCALPDEAELSHRLFTAALESAASGTSVAV